MADWECKTRQTIEKLLKMRLSKQANNHRTSFYFWYACYFDRTVIYMWANDPIGLSFTVSGIYTKRKNNQTLMKMILLLGVFKRCVETKGKISLLWIWSDRVSFLIDRFRALIKFQTNEIDHSKMVVISIDKRNAKPVTKVAFNRSGCDLICCCKRNKTPTEDRAFFHAFLVFFLYFSPRFTLNFVCGSG